MPLESIGRSFLTLRVADPAQWRGQVAEQLVPVTPRDAVPGGREGGANDAGLGASRPRARVTAGHRVLVVARHAMTRLGRHRDDETARGRAYAASGDSLRGTRSRYDQRRIGRDRVRPT